MKNLKKGFTLVELVIVITVIGILAAILIPTFTGVVENANEKAALSEVKNAYTEKLVEITSDDDSTNDKDLDGVTVIEYDGFYVTVADWSIDKTSTATHTLADGEFTAVTTPTE